MNSAGTGFPDYGCTLASLGVNPETHPQTPGSLNTPSALDGTLVVRANQQPLEGAYKIERFRFDAAATGGFVSEQQNRTVTGCAANGSGSYQDHKSFCGSQGNLQQIAQTSCTSIPQNLSTSDQQPLIVDNQHDRCHHHLQQARRCCLETTSFMANNPPLQCTCCDHKAVKGGTGRPLDCSDGCPNAKSQEDLAIIYDDQKKSRTLTRVYKPLNDVHFLNTSANTLADNFRVPPPPENHLN